MRIAAGAFGPSQLADATDHVLVAGQATLAGLFVAKVVGDSMDRIAADGSWCLWQALHGTGAGAAAPGDLLVVRRQDHDDPEAGAFLFKRWTELESGQYLEPLSTHPAHRRVLVGGSAGMGAVARFVCVLDAIGLP